jgi:hypothetical protein
VAPKSHHTPKDRPSLLLFSGFVRDSIRIAIADDAPLVAQTCRACQRKSYNTPEKKQRRTVRMGP